MAVPCLLVALQWSRDTCRASWLAFAIAPGPQILAVCLDICSHHSRHHRCPAETASPLIGKQS